MDNRTSDSCGQDVKQNTDSGVTIQSRTDQFILAAFMIKSVSNHSQPSGPSYTPAPAFLLKSKNSPLFNTLWAHYPMTYSASDTPFASIPLLNRSNAPRSKQKIKPSVAAKPPPFPVRTLSDRLPIVVRNERLNFDSRNTPVATMHRKDKRRKQRKIQLCNKYLATVQHYSLDSMSNSYSINDNTPNISNEHLLVRYIFT